MVVKNIITSIRLEQKQYDNLLRLKQQERKSVNSLILDGIDLIIAKHKKETA